MRDKKGDAMGNNKKNSSRPLTDNERQIVQTFFKENSGYFHFIYMLFCSDTSTEAEIIQECFLRIMNNIDTFLSMTPQKRKAYAIPIIEHLCIDKMRRENRVSFIPISEDIEVENSFLGSETHLSIMFLSKKLPERDWYILKSIYIDGLSKEELAQKLNCSIDSLRMLASRARKAARSILENESTDRLEKDASAE